MTKFPGESDDPFFPGEPRPVTDDDGSAERIQAEKAELRKTALTQLMGQTWFREWLMEYLASVNTFGITFGVGPTGFPDPNATFFHLGMKAAGEALWEQFDTLCPDLAALMRRETRIPK